LEVAMTVWLVSVSVKVMVAPGTTAPVGSVTMPWMEARNWAYADVEREAVRTRNAIGTKERRYLILMVPPKEVTKWQ
jgi:hypothetical protein